MATDVERLLDALVQGQTTANSTLDVIRDTLIHQAAGNRGPGGGGGPNPPNPPPRGGNPPPSAGSISGLFRSLINGAQMFGASIISNSSSSNSIVQSLGKGALGVTGEMAKLGGTVGLVGQSFGLVIQAGMKLYDFMDQQLKMYQDLNAAGIELNNGIFGFKKSSGQALLNFDQFSKVVKDNVGSISAMSNAFGDGTDHFAKLVNSVTMAQKSIGIYGLSQQQIADMTAKNYRIQNQYGGAAQMRQLNETQQTSKFIQQMDQLSKVLGINIESLTKKTEDFSLTSEAGNMAYYLEQQGMSAKQVTETMSAFSQGLAGAGEGGDFIQKLMTDFLPNGRIPDAKMLGPAMNFIRPMLEQLTQQMKSGLGDPASYTKSFMDNVGRNMGKLEEYRKIALQTNNKQLADNLQLLINGYNSLNEAALNAAKNGDKPKRAFETLQTNLENWFMNSWVNPINAYIMDSNDQAAQYLTDLFNNSTGFWDGFGTASKDLYFSLNGWVNKFGTWVADSAAGLGDLLSSWFGGTNAEKAVTDSNNSFMESYNKLNNSLNSYLGGVTDYLNTIDASTMGQKVKKGISSLGDEISSWFGGKPSQTVNQPQPSVQTVHGQIPNKPKVQSTPAIPRSQPPVKAKTELTKPIQVIPPLPEQQQPVQAKTAISKKASDDMMNILSNLTANMADGNNLLNQANKLLQSIKTNTQLQNNV